MFNNLDPVNAPITANAQTIPVYVGAACGVVISMVATSLVGHNATFEVSNNSTNGTDGTWYPIQVQRTNASTLESTTGVLAATPGYAWSGNLAGLCWFRIRATAHTSGRADYTVIRSEQLAIQPLAGGGTTTVSGAVTLSGTANSVQGGAAHDAAIVGNPVRIGGRAITANYAAVATGDQADFICTTVGAQIVKLGAIPELDFQAVTTLTTTTAAALRAAPGAGIKAYLTGLQYQNTNATATQVNVLRGTTVIASYQAPANMAVPATITYITPLQTAANEALNVQAVTTGASVLVSAQGYVSP